jgi:ArsR family metal-binding transcriptional regulator
MRGLRPPQYLYINNIMEQFDVHKWNKQRRAAALNEEKYIVTISKNGTTTETNVHNTKEDAEAQAKKINGGFMDRPDAKFKAVVSLDK